MGFVDRIINQATGMNRAIRTLDAGLHHVAFRYRARLAWTVMKRSHFLFSGSSAPSRCSIGEGMDNAQPAGVPVAIRSPPMLPISRGLDIHLAFCHI